MRILYVFPEPLPLPKARAIQVVHTVVALADLGVELDFAYVPVAGISDPFKHYGVACPANVRLLSLSRTLPGILGRLRLNSNKLFLHRLLAWLKASQPVDGMPDFVFVRHLKLAYGLSRKLPNLPLIYEAHELFADTAPQKKRECLALQEKYVLNHATHLISISSALAGELRRRYSVARDIVLVPSAADVPTIVPEKDWTVARHKIVYAGSFFPWKGVDDLVAAAEYLPGCTINIVGGDVDGIARLRKLLPVAGAQINFLGALSHGETLRELASACIAVLPNRAGSVSTFTSPLKLFEYMAAGCAIVASDIPVFREVLGANDAAWFAAGSPQSLAAALKSLLQDTEVARSLGCRLQVRVEAFSWKARAQSIIDLARALGQTPGA